VSKRFYFISFLLLCFLSCKKENDGIPTAEEILTEIPSIRDVDFSYSFENIIFNYNLKAGDIEKFDFLDISKANYVERVGMELAQSKELRMKYPSTLDRSQLIFDVQFRPKVIYKDLKTGASLALNDVISDKVPFEAKIQESTVFIGKSLLSIAGTVFGFKIRGDTVYLELYKMTSGTSASIIDESENQSKVGIPIKQFFGDSKDNFWYLFNLRFVLTKDANLNCLEVENIQTGAKIKAWGKSKVQSNGCQWGYGFIRSEQDKLVRVQNVIYRSLDLISPKILFLGHSFIEGNSLGNTLEGFNARYAVLIKEKLNGSAVISGMGGATSQNILDRLKMDMEPFFPKYVVIDCIANERSFDLWRGNMLKLIKAVENKGAIPILVTGAPRLGYENIIREANNFIRNTAGYKYLDLNDVVAVNKSVTDWKPDFSLNDLVHPSVLGHKEIANRFFRDFQEVLE